MLKLSTCKASYYWKGKDIATELQFLVNKRAFEKLTKEYQAMLIAAMKAVTADMYTDNFADRVDFGVA